MQNKQELKNIFNQTFLTGLSFQPVIYFRDIA